MRVDGIEPTSSAWKAEVLPLNYTRIEEEYEKRHAIRSSTVFLPVEMRTGLIEGTGNTSGCRLDWIYNKRRKREELLLHVNFEPSHGNRYRGHTIGRQCNQHFWSN